MRLECRERFPRHRLQRKPLVSDPGMHHGTCVTHVPWCMSGSLIRSGEENVPGIPGACASRNFAYLARDPWIGVVRSLSNTQRTIWNMVRSSSEHDDVITWKHFPRYWPFVIVRVIHWSPVDFPHKGQWYGALRFSLIYVQTNGWANNRDAGVLRPHRVYYDVTVMKSM